MEDKVTNAFNKHPIVFDDVCGLSPTVQRVYIRLYSWLWGNDANEWRGSYPKLAQLTKLSVGSVHEARKKLVEAGLIGVSTLPNKGNTDTLSIKVTPDRLWTLNKQYCTLSLNERDIFAQQYSWETLDQLAQYLSDFEKQRSSLSENERRLSNNENRQAQRLSKSEKPLSNNERQRVYESASEAGSRVPTDEDTDITDTIQMKESSITLTEEEQFIFERCKDYTPTLNKDNKMLCAKIAKKVKTQEQFDSLYAFTFKRLPPKNDGKVYLGNMVKELDVWEKQGQQIAEGQGDDYIPGPMPMDTYRSAGRICLKYHIRLKTSEYVIKELDRIYNQVQSKSRFERLMGEAGEIAETIEVFLKQLENAVPMEVHIHADCSLLPHM